MPLHPDLPRFSHPAMAGVSRVLGQSSLPLVSKGCNDGAQKSNISCISRTPPINEPAKRQRSKANEKQGSGHGSGNSTNTMVPSQRKNSRVVVRINKILLVKLLFPGLTGLALAARIDQWPHHAPVAHLPFLYRAANACHLPTISCPGTIGKMKPPLHSLPT